MTAISIGSPLLYTIFAVLVLAAIAIDMFSLNRSGSTRVSMKQAGIWSAIWVSLALAFNYWLYWTLSNDPSVGAEIAKQKSLEFLTGYVLEKSLAVDNVFVFIMIFAYFKVPPEYQRRVLVYGVLGAIILRTVLISVGAVIVSEFSWVLYLFGAFLVFTGIKMMLPEKESNDDLGNNGLIRWLRNHIRITDTIESEKFFVFKNGLWFATPLFLVLVMVELSDVVFAVDSIPAIFAVTTDPFIVLTSNIFAILGLRAMYFLLANVIDRFHYLKYGLAVVLTYIGIKMLIVEIYHVPVHWSLAIVVSILSLSMLVSWFKPRK